MECRTPPPRYFPVIPKRLPLLECKKSCQPHSSPYPYPNPNSSFFLRECCSRDFVEHRLCRRQQRAEIVDRLQAFSEDTGRQCGSRSVTDRRQRGLMWPDPPVEVGQMHLLMLLHNLDVYSVSNMQRVGCGEHVHSRDLSTDTTPSSFTCLQRTQQSSNNADISLVRAAAKGVRRRRVNGGRAFVQRRT